METNRNIEYCLSNSTNFAKLYALTLDVFNITEFPEGTFTHDGNAWSELVDVWKTDHRFGAKGIFLEAVHRIMWDISSEKFDPAYKEIIPIVIEELLSDGDAFNAWDTLDACTTAITDIGNINFPLTENSDEYINSIEHYYYLEWKMLWKIQYSKNKYVDEGAIYAEHISLYESAIKKIVPVAKSWDETYWYNEAHIYDELIKLYGVDYRDDYVEYGRILQIMMNHNEDKYSHEIEEAWFASNIKRMPMSLAKVIWPTDTEDKITNMFLWATQAAEIQANSDKQEEYAKRKAIEIHPIGIFEYSAIKESWLYEPVCERYANYHGNDEDINDIKRHVFTVSVSG